MSLVECTSTIILINQWIILKLPQEASILLPSRGMVMAESHINNIPFQCALEPDGLGGHWFKIEDAILETGQLKVGDTVSLSIKVLSNWTEPELPEDFLKVLSQNQLLPKWEIITPKAKWDWIRWIRSTKNPTTRNHRIEVACSKLSASATRPCCFNRNACTETAVSKNGILLNLDDFLDE